ncbi:hypothetical protein LX64_02950 [Chitinophaga skermanii]|uniref:Uncharacterized protein n=1 Tax=Chitinophaga skermanii TaxID=331697 RepID=A0A327QL59_9BACT|nr:hypothetical protein [Chitinophaga skermanii]RAJ04073.1 hypothetical protein LX64_02950 [Chitinophaga skermanii]
MSNIHDIPVEFIKENLEKLASEFQYITIKYEFNESINTHIVELTPIYEYYNNKELDNAWIPISLEFKGRYELEDIAFISSDSSLKVTNPQLEWNKIAEYTILDFHFSEKVSFYLDKFKATDILFPSITELVELPNFSALIKSCDTSFKVSFSKTEFNLDYQNIVNIVLSPRSDDRNSEVFIDDDFTMAA